jgi:hypothetical protein
MAEGDINTDKLRLLKFVVVFMGVLLVVGTAALFGLIAYKMKHSGAAAASSTAPVADCKGGSYKVTAPGEMLGASLDGANALLVFSKDGHRELVVLDYCTGRVISRFQVGE